MNKSPLSFEGRVWEKVAKTPTCWLWLGTKNSAGYGVIGISTAYGDTILYVHRAVYNLSGRRIPCGLTLDHLKEKCGNRACCNPSHLEPVTSGENARRGIKAAAKTHCPKGHEYSPDNIYYNKRPDGWAPSRRCKVCTLKRAAARYAPLKKK